MLSELVCLELGRDMHVQVRWVGVNGAPRVASLVHASLTRGEG